MIQYTVHFPRPETHYAEVEALFPSGGTIELELFLAVWTPGSYMVREYSRNLEGLRAETQQGSPLPCTKTRKNRWKIGTGGAPLVRVSYRLYCREMSVRTNWVEDGFALLNGAPTFIAVASGMQQEHRVTVQMPASWTTSISGMEEIAPNCFTAPDYDTLVDSPIVAGNPQLHPFLVSGISHVFANVGDVALWSDEPSIADVSRLVHCIRDFWGALPYSKFVFLNMIVESAGGLEHKNSMCLMTGRFTTRTRRAYVSWLGLVSHEFFHVWNVKRLRPAELGPFDYENENYTRSLWVAEGFTEYYGELMVKRAGLIDQVEYLSSLSGLVQKLETTPGRRVQAVAESSFDAWIKLYRPDENSNNTTISYYVKGAVIGWLLDVKIRKLTQDKRSLDDLMRVLYSRFGGEAGFSEAQLAGAAEEVAGVSLAGFLETAAATTQDLDYSEALEWLGLRWSENPESAAAFLGAEIKVDAGRLLVAKIERDSDAFLSGLSVDDEIVAIDDYRVRPDGLAQRLEQYRVGATVCLLIARRERLLRIELRCSPLPRRWQLECDPAATSVQAQRLAAWLH